MIKVSGKEKDKKYILNIGFIPRKLNVATQSD